MKRSFGTRNSNSDDIGLILLGIILCSIIFGGGAGFFVSDSGLDHFNEIIQTYNKTIEDQNSRIQQLQESHQIINNDIEILENENNILKNELIQANQDIANIITDIRNAENLELVEVTRILNDLDHRMDSTEAYRLLRKTLAKPGGYIVDTIVDEIINELKNHENVVIKNAAIYGEDVAKVAIERVINSESPSQYWYSVTTNRVSDTLYKVYVKTYYFAVDASIVNIGRLEITIMAKVDVEIDQVIPGSIIVDSVTMEIV